MKARSIALFLAASAAMTACADASTVGGSSSPSLAHGRGSGDLLLRWGYEGGFTPPEFQLTNLPAFSLYGDGTIVRPGPQIEIYPGPALPALETLAVDERGVQAILDAALDAGLDTQDELTDLGSVGIADAPDTVFTLRAAGVDRTVHVYALSEVEGRPPGMPKDEFEARTALLELVRQLGSVDDWLPDGSLGEVAVYEPAGVRAFVSTYRGQDDLPQRNLDWPLATSLADAGDDMGNGFRCIAVTGDDWSKLLEPIAREANRLTPWTSGGQRFAVAFRPLLPDESGC
ncbi:MAG: hypothetical protein OEV60_11490 [Actinomycetota bacterium]|nr:hypothetical protein [Actinomycetota bacterium]